MLFCKLSINYTPLGATIDEGICNDFLIPYHYANA
jgi:hypothetical protein